MRLKENHPDLIKFEKLCNYAEELGISISLYIGANRMPVNIGNNEYYLYDIDSDTAPDEFPPRLDYKLIFETVNEI